MRITTLALTLATMALGVSAGCKRTNDVCSSSVQAGENGQTDPWACNLDDDLPCQTSCLTVGSRQVDSVNWEYLRCCKPASGCKRISSLCLVLVIAPRISGNTNGHL